MKEHTPRGIAGLFWFCATESRRLKGRGGGYPNKKRLFGKRESNSRDGKGKLGPRPARELPRVRPPFAPFQPEPPGVTSKPGSREPS